ncbi:MAG: hypothetical protein JST89_00640 [Cyanobacteria bacterium SZAS-4]|nr:hypothetical protein [Cyanobacteria bacterium SZAS-4]
MTEQTKQSTDEQSTKCESHVAKPEENKSNAPTAAKRAYVKPTLRKFSQIDYVTAYGVD